MHSGKAAKQQRGYTSAAFRDPHRVAFCGTSSDEIIPNFECVECVRRVAALIVQMADALCEKHRFALADQMQRAAISVPSNIAEGYGRLTRKEWRHYLAQARGSLYELETQLDIAIAIKAISNPTKERDFIAKIGKGLTTMIRHATS